jgi:hypothetical protein
MREFGGTSVHRGVGVRVGVGSEQCTQGGFCVFGRGRRLVVLVEDAGGLMQRVVGERMLRCDQGHTTAARIWRGWTSVVLVSLYVGGDFGRKERFVGFLGLRARVELGIWEGATFASVRVRSA